MKNPNQNNQGFSIVELIIAMTITLVLAAVGSSILSSAFRIRSRENKKSDGLADAQRGLNLMTREIANAGYGLTGNGIVVSDSGTSSIRVRSNLNAASGETTSSTATDRDEDVKYLLYTDSSNSYIVRLDVNTAAQEMILANRVDALNIRYYADKVTYSQGTCDISDVRDAYGNTTAEVTSKSSAKYIVISVCVTLPAVGTENTAGYQPPTRVQLTSDTSLRNSYLVNY